MARPRIDYSEIFDNSLIDDLDALYNVHALLSAKARENPDWGHVSEWFYKYMREAERAYLLSMGIGRPSKLFDKQLLFMLEDAARKEDLAKASSIVDELADSIPRMRVLNGIALKHVCLGRILASALIALGAILLATSTGNIIISLTALVLGGIGTSSVMLCFSPLGRGTLGAAALGLLFIEVYLMLQKGVSWLVYSSILVAWLIAVALRVQEGVIAGIYEGFRRYIADTRTNVNTPSAPHSSHETVRER